MVESILWLMLAMLSASPTGWLEVRTVDPNERLDTLLNQSEDSRPLGAQWRCWWPDGQPSHMTYQRVDGGIGP
jgi:hypothetical protein